MRHNILHALYRLKSRGIVGVVIHSETWTMGVRGLGKEAIYNIFRYSILIGYWGILDLRPKHIKIKRNQIVRGDSWPFLLRK